MDAVVLAGGYATRLWPITKSRPKMLLPLGESTVIDRIFSGLENDDRIENVYVSTNERFANAFRDHLTEAPFEKPILSVEATTAEEQKHGVVRALSELIDREGIEDDLLVIAGDNLISFDISDFIDRFQYHDAPTLAAYDVGSRERAMSYGVLELDGRQVVEFQEKPDNPQSSLVSIACYGFPSESLSLLDEYLAGGNNPDEPGWFVDWMQTRQSVYAFSFEDAWFDIGTPESYLEALDWVLGGDCRVADSATTVTCSLEENVCVMEDAVVKNAALENTIVFPDTKLRDCVIRNSIIGQATRIKGIDLRDSIVGQHTELVGGD